ncbi:MAG: glycosyltransferase family 39 protein [Candidatus Krumholzibacteriota bacterium]|nr:glycosyltransferase family 39 protein [Candidatus Krumholzibacteriota bacterium]
MSKTRSTVLNTGLLLIVLIFHTSVAWQDFGTLASNGFLYDDSFYAFNIAKNIAEGNGASFDSIHPTTGFQPLYVFLLVPVFMICGENCVFPVHIALTFLALFTTITTWLVYRISRRYAGVAASLAAAALWGLSPVVMRQSANGLETAITTFFIALSVYYYLEKVRPVKNIPPLRFLLLGIFLGLTVLSRIDSVFLVLALLLDYLLLLRRRKSPGSALIPLSLLPLGVLFLFGPWLLFNIIESGSALQDSGSATRYISLAYASYFGQGTRALTSAGPDPAFVWVQVVHSMSVMKVIPPVHILFRAIDKTGSFLNSYRAFHAAGNILGVILLSAAIFKIVRWRKDTGKASRREIDFLFLFSVLLLVSYSFYIFGTFFFLRYYYPIYFIASVYFAFFLQDIFDWLKTKRLLVKRIALSFGLVYLILFASFSYSQAFRSRRATPFYEIAGWIKENTSKEEKIGVFQAGTIGYLCDRQVINLDGKVNREALDALKKGSLDRYVEEEGIDVIIDHTNILEIFFDLESENRTCTVILDKRMEPTSGWIAVRRR